MFGSVPLKTYLPDGDIDVSIFCQPTGSIKETWTGKLQEMLEAEQRNRKAQFKIGDIQVINAEVGAARARAAIVGFGRPRRTDSRPGAPQVKLLKCLIDNIVVDISYAQLGGLCTVNFLEEIDRKVGKDHLFKRSIILVGRCASP